MNDFDGRNGNGYQPKPGQKMGAPPGAEHGVTWSEKALAVYAEYREAAA